MNNSEGQTQEPVGGMKTAKEIVQKHKSIEYRNARNRFLGGYSFEYLNIHSAELAAEEYHNQFTPPPAPIKTEGEDENQKVRHINPCPFCGGIENKDVFFGQLADIPKYKITCIPCDVTLIDDRPDKVIANWNRRTAPHSPVGIDVKNTHVYNSPYPSEVIYKSDKNFMVRLKVLFERIAKGECNIDSAQDYLFESRTKAGYATSPQSERINQLEGGIKNFIDWLSEKRPYVTGIGAPLSILQGLLDGLNFSPPQSSTEEEKDVWRQAVGEVIKSEQDNSQFMDWPDTLLSILQSKFKISKR